MLYVIPIEPLEERYSEQWLRWTKAYLKKTCLRKDYRVINPPAYKSISNGAFLDVVNTNVYKNAQLKIILGMFQKNQVKDGDIFWFHDMWFPGLEMLAYMRDALGLKIKIYGMLHAGTYDQHDFLAQKGMRGWGHYLEASWFKIVNGVFVATNFHKQLICKNSTYSHPNRIYITGFPMYAEEFALPQNAYDERDKIIVFPHRLDSEKQPDLFDEFKQELLEKCLWSRDYTFIKTKDVCHTKEEYYALLRRAEYAVSFALQETWGIAQTESALCGCVPIVPDRLSYSEMYPSQFKYSQDNRTDVSMAVHLINTLQNHIKPEAVGGVLRQLQNDMRRNGESAFNNMMEIMHVR